jgi:hypothetical protein
MRKKLFLLATVATLLAAVGTATAAGGGPAPPDAALLATYEPLLQFDPLEQFQPTQVQSFISAADLEQLTTPGTWTVVKDHAAPGALPDVGTWRLNEQPCSPATSVGGLACYAATVGTGDGPTTYGHVVHENGETVLEYWFFYYDDVYSYTYPPSDLFWQAHEGDWEEAMVVLSGNDQPLSVGYSQHCLGQTLTWAETPRFGDTHPIVHVALGSHANYFSAGTHPINPACIPPAAIAILTARGLPLPVDYAFAGPTAGPSGSGGATMAVQPIDGQTPSWVQFPGYWGEAQYFHAPAPIGTVPLGNSPVGPAFHPEWSDPLGTLATWPTG